MTDLWQSLPAEFRFPEPEAQVTLWRGDKLGVAATGMACRLTEGDPQQVVLDAARQGRGALTELIDGHTSMSPDSPLVSVTPNLRMAQLFAGVRSANETIYEVTLPARRLVRDPYKIGAPSWPADSEVFVVGGIRPSDIKQIKTNNADPAASELLYERDGREYRATSVIDAARLPATTEPNPLGIWAPPEGP